MSQIPPDTAALTPRNVLLAVLHRKLLFISVFIAVFAAAVLAAMRVTYRYQSAFQLLVKPSIRETFDLERASLQGSAIATGGSQQLVFMNASQILQSRDLIERLAREMIKAGGPPPIREAKNGGSEKTGGDPNGYEEVVSWVKRLVLPPEYAGGDRSDEETAVDLLQSALAPAIQIKPVFGTTVIEVTVTWSDPKTAYDIATCLQEVCRSFYADSNPLIEKVKRLDALTQESENRRIKNLEAQTAVLQQSGVTDIDRAMAQTDTRIAELEALHTTCQVDMSAASGEMKFLNGQVESVAPTLPPAEQTLANPAYTVLNGYLQSLNLMRMTSPQRRGETSRLDQAIEETGKKLVAEKPVLKFKATPLPNPAYSDLQQRLRTLRAQSNGIQEKCDTINHRLGELKIKNQELQRKQVEMNLLRTERDLIENEIRNQKQSLYAARILLAQSEFSNLHVIEKPRLSGAPLKNRRPLILALGFFAGLGVAALLCFLLIRNRGPIVSPEDLKSCTGLDVVAAVPTCSWWNFFLLRRLQRE